MLSSHSTNPISKPYDFFLSHASEDKEAIARPLYELLSKLGLSVWLDEVELLPGDDLINHINQGLRYSNCGIIVFSDAFFSKYITMEEAHALTALQQNGMHVVPILHNIEHKELTEKFALLGSKLSISTTEGINLICDKLQKRAIRDWGHKPYRSQGEYRNALEINPDLFARSVRSVENLLLVKDKNIFENSEDVSRPGVWMGSNNPTLVNLGFGIFWPFIVYFHGREEYKRSVGNYESRDRVIWLLLETMYNAFVFDEKMANDYDEKLNYTPRVRGWRSKRVEEPQKFLLQGINDREMNSLCSFLSRTPQIDIETIKFNEFEKIYNNAFDTQKNGYKEIGLLFNALYNYSPQSRPIFIRILCLWYASMRLVLNTHTGAMHDASDYTSAATSYIEEFIYMLNSSVFIKDGMQHDLKADPMVNYLRYQSPGLFSS
ncbi:MAG: toll/interleukin-1 receptor domain-containing protein [Pseudomonadota bacterium]